MGEVRAAGMVVMSPERGSAAEALAAREVRRYVYLRTGVLLELATAKDELTGAGGILVAQRDSPLVGEALGESTAWATARGLGPGEHFLKTVEVRGRRWLVLTGGDGPGTLYAAYRLAEHWGVRFYLHGDVMPDGRVEFRLPTLDERQAPMFGLRGIQPFHDFPEGPDWWNVDDYLAVIAQLPKLRMNFFGLHTYPEGRPNAEPTVWIGRAADVGDGGRVKFAYPASYQNTLRGNWGYERKETSKFVFGGASLFEQDAFGPEVMDGQCPEPQTPEACAGLFEGTGRMLQAAFAQARAYGIRTCVGTETPLVVPRLVQERLRAAGVEPGNPMAVRDLYEGIFRWVEEAYRPDYYWFWTPEGWTWEGTKEEQIRDTLHDLLNAVAAHEKVQPSFRLATCGWVLGPPQDRALFDKALPKDVALSCINREVGRTPVEPGFAAVRGRGKWAIPWLEDDPALTIPQLWVGRMRRDAADAYRYGCDGLMGIHWRTRVLSPNVAALARAAWTQSPWSRLRLEAPPPLRVPGPVGGAVAHFPNHEIADTAQDPVYQSVRYNVSAYQFPVPNGRCRLVLKFCEPHYGEVGKRVFGVKVQGQSMMSGLDIYARVGQNRALDFTFEQVEVTNGWLTVEFVPEVEFPSIAGLVIEAGDRVRRVNCGGAAWNDFEADLPGQDAWQPPLPRVDDFYTDWAASEFGAAAGPAAAALFTRLDGALPRPADWVNGPGGIKPDGRPWLVVAREYGFVEELEALRSRVNGAGSRERFDYWVSTFRYLRAMAQVNCYWGEYEQAAAAVRGMAEEGARRERARSVLLPLRVRLVGAVAEVYRHLLAHVGNTGELGTVANWDQHLLPGLLEKPGAELAGWLGGPLPPEAMPWLDYRGPTRVLVTTQRTTLGEGEPLDLRVRLLTEGAPRQVAVFLRPLGKGSFTRLPLPLVARGVHRVRWQTREPGADFEYYVEVVDAGGRRVRWPATAPEMNQTVVRTRIQL